jgi:hypothetical protein
MSVLSKLTKTAVLVGAGMFLIQAWQKYGKEKFGHHNLKEKESPSEKEMEGKEGGEQG